MTETIPPHPFDELEALAWLRSQPEGRVSASAAELGRERGWNRMRTGRRLKAWQKVGYICRNAEAIIVTAPVTPTVTEGVSVTVMPETRGSETFHDTGQARCIRHSAGALLHVGRLLH